jgi:hypothetical protein
MQYISDETEAQAAAVSSAIQRKLQYTGKWGRFSG